jgi:pimeloyl-ACP methyl ester carboxylesterase
MRLLRWSLTAVLIACFGVLLMYRVKDPERRTLDEAARREAPGRFVHLADGVTHYETAGPDTGRVVVLAAGFSVPAYIWDSLHQGLADSGFRVVRYDYYGRGWSDRPEAAYDQDLFVRQLAGLLDSLRITAPVDLAGLSFGGAIITSFADRYPGRVRSLMYFDPVFNTGRPLPPEERSARAWNIHMVLRGGSDAMAAGQVSDFLHPERHPDWVARYRVQQQFRGTRESLRRTRTAIAVAPHQEEQLRRLGATPRPVLIVWGRQDRVAPFEDSEALLAAMPRATFVPVDSAAHLPHLERTGVVVPAVVGFLRGEVSRQRRSESWVYPPTDDLGHELPERLHLALRRLPTARLPPRLLLVHGLGTGDEPEGPPEVAVGLEASTDAFLPDLDRLSFRFGSEQDVVGGAEQAAFAIPKHLEDPQACRTRRELEHQGLPAGDCRAIGCPMERRRAHG